MMSIRAAAWMVFGVLGTVAHANSSDGVQDAPAGPRPALWGGAFPGASPPALQPQPSGLERTRSATPLLNSAPSALPLRPLRSTHLPEVNAAGFEYILDDGSGGFAIGPSEFDAMMTWGNYFTAEPGAEWLTTIRVSFPSGLPVGTRVTLIVFDDPDDDLDPTNAIPLALASGRSTPTGPQDFVDFPIRPVRIEGGFFVAAAVRAFRSQAVARMDQDTLGVRSWLFFSDNLQLDLSAAPFILRMDQSPFRGTWMVRAIGEASGCPADLDGDGEATFFDFLVFQDAFAAGDLLADFDLDGELTFFDFLAFQEVFAAGC